MEIKDCEEGKVYYREKLHYKYFWHFGGSHAFISLTSPALVSSATFTNYPDIKVIREATKSETIWFHKCAASRKVLPFKCVLNLYGLITKENEP